MIICIYTVFESKVNKHSSSHIHPQQYSQESDEPPQHTAIPQARGTRSDKSYPPPPPCKTLLRPPPPLSRCLPTPPKASSRRPSPTTMMESVGARGRYLCPTLEEGKNLGDSINTVEPPVFVEKRIIVGVMPCDAVRGVVMLAMGVGVYERKMPCRSPLASHPNNVKMKWCSLRFIRVELPARHHSCVATPQWICRGFRWASRVA